MRISEPGVYTDVAAVDYHRDPCPVPSLSSSVARALVEQSPLHAYAKHPRLGGTYDDKPERQKDLGTAAHKLLLGKGAECVVIDADDYRSKAAQEARATAYSKNMTPLLRCDLSTIETMHTAARDQLLAFPELRPLVDGEGQSEVVIVWREGEAWCRGMVDWMHPDDPIRADYKTTSASAHPQALSSRLFGTGVEVQDSFYTRGLNALGKGNLRSLYIAQECEAPYALSVVELDPQAKELGDEKVMLALHLWAECIKRDQWPGYPQHIAVAECPPWTVSAWNNRQLATEALREIEEHAA
jgi:hypothetical protein